MNKFAILTALGIFVGLSLRSTAHGQLIGPTPYLCFDTATTTATGDCANKDSPFKDVDFSYFHLDDFEDQAINTPGVTAVASCTGHPAAIGCPFASVLRFTPAGTDSVDEDDGAIDGLGQTTSSGGQAMFALANPGIEFSFDAAVLDALPTHAGIVWTDGSGTWTFEAFDAAGASMGTVTAGLGDGVFAGTTADDRFFGAINPAGISKIKIGNPNSGGGVEVDHLQYGLVALKGCVAPPSGLVSWWPGDGSANDLVDGNDGTLENGATFGTGKVGDGFSLDGVDDRVEIADAANLDITGPLTLDAWVDFNTVGGTLGNAPIVAKWGDTNTTTAGYGLFIFSDGTPFVAVSMDGNQLISAASSVALSSGFHHVVGVYTGAALEIYVDGELRGSAPFGGTVFEHDEPLVIGGYGPQSGGTGVIEGLIDEVEIFERALTEEEIQAIFSAGSAGKCKRHRGTVIVNNDDWTLSDAGLASAFDSDNFVRNVASFFTGSSPGNFLAYSENFGLTEPSLAAIMTGAGHAWTVDTTVSFDAGTLQQFDAVFLAGPVDGSAPDNSGLTEYVEGGGNVYLAGGTGRFGDPGTEADAWNTFLNSCGLAFDGSDFNNIIQDVPIDSDHPLFANVFELHFRAGNNVMDLDASDPTAEVLLTFEENGLIAFSSHCHANPVTVVPGVNAATFVHDPTVGGLGSFFGTFPDVPFLVAGDVPLPRELGPVQVEFFPAGAAAAMAASGRKGQAGGVLAPLLFVTNNQINLQIPWEVDTTMGPVTVVVTVDGVSSDPVEVPLSPAAPGVFTFDFGPGRAVAINNADGKVAQPIGSLAAVGIDTEPVTAGDVLIILATGLGPVTPDAVTGDDSLDEQGAFVRRDTTFQPKVFIGGVEAQVLFSGLSPQFVGVYQVNVFVPGGVEPGDTVSLVIEVDGVRSREDVTIAVSP